MQRRPNLRRAQQRQVSDYLKERLERRVERLLRRGVTPTATQLGIRLYRALSYAARRGSPLAHQVLQVTAEARLVCLAGDELRYRERFAAQVRHRGQRRSILMPSRMALPVRIAGVPTGESAYEELIDWEFEALRQSAAEDEAVIDVAHLRVAVKRKLLALEQQAPGARTPRLAAVQLGFDIYGFLAS